MAQQPDAAGRTGTFVPDSWLEDARRRSLRALLKTTIVLSVLLAALGFVFGEWFYGVISVAGLIVYVLLLAMLPRWGPLLAGYIFTITFNFITLLYMARGRGIFSVNIVLVPAGMFIGALLLKKRHVHFLFAAVVVTVAAIGYWKIVWPGRLRVMLPAHPPEIVIVSLMLVVASVLAWIIVEALREMFVERSRAESLRQQAMEEVEARNEALTMISDLTHRLQRGLTIEEIAQEAISVLQRLTRPPLVAVYLVDESESWLELVAQDGFGSAVERGHRLPLSGSLSGAAFRQKGILVTSDIASDERLEPATRELLLSHGLKSGVSIPLAAGRAFGTLNLIYNSHRNFTRVELDTFEAVGQAVALGIANARHLSNLEYQAFHDALTGLPNRASFFREFDALVTRSGDATAAAAVIDIHRFRDVNDALGHRLSDDLIRKFAARLTDAGAAHGAVVFRIAGGEFALLCAEARSEEQIARALREIVMTMRESVEVGALTLNVGSYAGFVIAEGSSVSGEEILRRAHVALRSAANSATPVVRYVVESDQNAPERLALMADLASALHQHDEITLHFQPIVDIASGDVVAFEALVRWRHPKLGLLYPGTFLPLAEESDLINELTDVVVSKALAQLHEWHSRYPKLRMSVNLSARNLLDRNCPQRMVEIIQAAGVEASQVAFELTETAVMTDRDLALFMLSRITETGAHLVIDDFGTGFSSLSYLRHFPVNEIKIDRSFVSDMADGGHSHAIVRSTVQLAQTLGLTVVAEGIEDQRTADALGEIGCPYAQGYFFARPAPADEIERQLSNGGNLCVARHH